MSLFFYKILNYLKSLKLKFLNKIKRECRFVYFDKYKKSQNTSHTLLKNYNIIYNSDIKPYSSATDGIILSDTDIKLFSLCSEACDSKESSYFWNVDSKTNHPVQLIHMGLVHITAFYETQNNSYLIKAREITEHLISLTTVINGKMFFPYNFDFPLHSYKGEKHYMKAPWFSGMAQGMGLSLFAKLYTLTNDEKYKRFCEQIFSTILNDRNIADCAQEPWISYHDDAGYLWIEEYPQDDFPNNTLNGFLFAVMGLYDYWLIDQSDKAKSVLNECLKTTEFYMPNFRVKNKVSYYNLKYKIQSKFYHKLHVSQLRCLNTFTSCETFGSWADTLEKDCA